MSGERPSGAQLVVYRCPTPTNVLCPCGAVARRLDRLELAYRTERVPYRRSGRPEIEELTRQTRVPVLVDGEEIVHDSKRILQYLDWKYGKETPARQGARGAGRRGRGGIGIRLYNLKRWIRRRRPSS